MFIFKLNEETNALERKAILNFCFGKTETSAQAGMKLRWREKSWGLQCQKNRKVLTKDKFCNLRRGWVQNKNPSTERVLTFTKTIYIVANIIY